MLIPSDFHSQVALTTEIMAATEAMEVTALRATATKDSMDKSMSRTDIFLNKNILLVVLLHYYCVVM